MERSVEHIELLLERYFEATASDAEVGELREFFASAETIPPHLAYARAMFGGIAALGGECAPPKADKQPPKRRITVRTMRICAGLAAAAVAVGLFVLASYLNRPYCYINGVPVRDAAEAMQTTVYFERLGDFDRPVDAMDGILEQLKNKE